MAYTNYYYIMLTNKKRINSTNLKQSKLERKPKKNYMEVKTNE